MQVPLQVLMGVVMEVSKVFIEEVLMDARGAHEGGQGSVWDVNTEMPMVLIDLHVVGGNEV